MRFKKWDRKADRDVVDLLLKNMQGFVEKSNEAERQLAQQDQAGDQEPDQIKQPAVKPITTCGE
ncbi:MAG: hypothetical protein WCI73_00155 [Phycisphaerae bacterium]